MIIIKEHTMYDKFELYIMTIYSYIEKAVPYLVVAAVLNVLLQLIKGAF